MLGLFCPCRPSRQGCGWSWNCPLARPFQSCVLFVLAEACPVQLVLLALLGMHLADLRRSRARTTSLWQSSFSHSAMAHCDPSDTSFAGLGVRCFPLAGLAAEPPPTSQSTSMAPCGFLARTQSLVRRTLAPNCGKARCHRSSSPSSDPGLRYLELVPLSSGLGGKATLTNQV
jgi:hypothetical protein